MRHKWLLGFMGCLCTTLTVQATPFDIFLHPPKGNAMEMDQLKHTMTQSIHNSQNLPLPQSMHLTEQPFETHDAQGFQDALQQLSMMAHIENNITDSKKHTPTIFEGQVARCRHLKHVPLSKSCCSLSIKNHGLHINGCRESEYQLAMARRSGRAHLVGTYCAKHLKVGFKTCLQENQVFCVFPSQLARLVQEQGRDQLNRLHQKTTSNAQHNATYQSLKWPYQSGTGQWRYFLISGQRVAVWQWPEITKDHIPIQVRTTGTYTLLPGAMMMVPGVTINLNCPLNHCHAVIHANNQTQTVPVPKVCTPTLWHVGQSTVHRRCAPDTPGYRFQLLGTTPWLIEGPTFLWRLNEKTQLSGTGSCHHNQCMYSMQVQNNHKDRKFQWSFPLVSEHPTLKNIPSSPISLQSSAVPHQLLIGVCADGNACGTLPDVVSEPKAKGWSFQRLSTTTEHWHTLNQRLSLQGHCHTGMCDFRFRQWGISAPLDTIEKSTSWTINHHDVITLPHFQVQPCPVSDQNTTHLPIKIKPTGGSWTTYPLPLFIPMAHPLTVHHHPLLRVWGGCQSTEKTCTYHWIIHLPTQKYTWGTPHHPHCEGFTPKTCTQINWHQLHLDGYTHQIPYTPLNAKKIQSSISDTAKHIQEIHQNAQLLASQPNTESYHPMRLWPLEGQGPFTITALLSSYWPQYLSEHDPHFDPARQVKAVKIYWGDGTMRTQTRSALRYRQHRPVFVIKHIYDPPNQKTEVMQIMAIFYTDSGTFVATGTITNIWNNTPENQNLGSSAEHLKWVPQPPAEGPQVSHGQTNP